MGICTALMDVISIIIDPLVMDAHNERTLNSKTVTRAYPMIVSIPVAT
jgi:uncharacterized protein YbaR (Trm112 family)